MKILLYCKNTEANKKALAITVEQAKAFDAAVTLVSCLTERADVPIEVVEKAEKKLQDHMKSVFTPAGIDSTAEVITTTASFGETIVQYAERHNIDTIIMSIQKRSKVGKVFFGSTTQYVILEAPCKVITIK